MTHSTEDSPTYCSWRGMKSRCYNPNVWNYKYYGGRGITVTKRWLNFDNFLADMGEKPEGLTLDRINNDGNYEPSNCRWATRLEQSQNRGDFINNLTFDGKTLRLTEWARELGIGTPALHNRIYKYGWSLEKALSTRKTNKWANR